MTLSTTGKPGEHTLVRISTFDGLSTEDNGEGARGGGTGKTEQTDSLTLQGLELDDERLDQELQIRRAINGGLTWSSLTSLDLSRNAVIELPATALCGLPSLTVLDVSRNRLKILPSELGALPQVRCSPSFPKS
eukprot:2541169-Pyramimonas_sp.AAC.1